MKYQLEEGQKKRRDKHEVISGRDLGENMVKNLASSVKFLNSVHASELILSQSLSLNVESLCSNQGTSLEAGIMEITGYWSQITM